MPESFVDRTRTGLAGALALLMRDQPQIADFVRSRLSTDDRPSFKRLHKEWLAACSAAGIAPDAYPFCTKGRGKKALRRYCRALDEAGPTGLATETHLARTATDGPLGRLVLVSVTIPVRCREEVPLPDGSSVVRVAPEVRALFLVDPTSTAILDSTPSDSAMDIARLLRDAVETSVEPSPRADGPAATVWNTVGMRCCHAVVVDRSVRLTADARRLLGALGESVLKGSTLADPVIRAVVERLHQLLAEQLVTSTAGHVDPPHTVARGDVARVLTTVTAVHNSTPQTRRPLGGRSPLAYLAECAHLGALPAPLDPVRVRKALSIQTVVRVRGGTGQRPYVTYLGVRYSSPFLRAAPELVGSALTVQVSVEDLRFPDVYCADGTPLGQLQPLDQRWCVPHSMAQRLEALRAERDGFRLGGHPAG